MTRKKKCLNSLDQSIIIQQAVEILNKEGLKKLSMRKLSEALNTTVGSLYWHIENKNELLQLLSDQIIQNISYPNSAKEWRNQFIELGYEYRQALFSIRGSVDIMVETVPSTPNRLHLIEQIYQILLRAGFMPKDVPLVSSLFNNYVLSYVRDEMTQIYDANSRGLDINKSLEQTKVMFQSLSDTKYPAIVKLADYSAFINNGQKQFEFGLHILLDGFYKRLQEY